MDDPKPAELRLFEVEFIGAEYRKEVRKVEAVNHEWAVSYVTANNFVRRVIRSVNRGPA